MCAAFTNNADLYSEMFLFVIYCIYAATYYNSIITRRELEFLMENLCADLDRSDTRLLRCEM